MYDEELTADENVARAFCSIADSLQGIGMGGNTHPGALENIGMMLRDLTSAVQAVADAVREDKGQA
jgi:hypothetical protein